MNYAVLEKEIKILPVQLQQDIDSYIRSVIDNYKNNAENNKNLSDVKKVKLIALNEIAGSMKETWNNIDPVEYQNQLRKERIIG